MGPDIYGYGIACPIAHLVRVKEVVSDKDLLNMRLTLDDKLYEIYLKYGGEHEA